MERDFNFHSILFSALADLCTRRHCFFRGHEAYVAFGVFCTEQHSFGHHSCQFGRFQVGENHNLHSDGVFRFVICFDSGDDLSCLASDFDLEAEELFWSFLTGSQEMISPTWNCNFSEIFEGNFLLRLKVDHCLLFVFLLLQMRQPWRLSVLPGSLLLFP